VSFFLAFASGGFNYTTGTAVGAVWAQNTDLQLLEGYAQAGFVAGNSPRNFNGQVNYHKSNCISPMLPVTLTIAPQPTVTATGTTICSGEVATISVGGATSYSVNGVANSSFPFTPANATNYVVTGMGTLNGCVSNTAVATVSVN